MYENILKGLQKKEIVLPWIENAFMSDKWPDKYNIEIDSSPYYGKGDGYFHPSTHPLMSPRQLYYLFHPEHRKKMVVERRNLQSHMTLAMGSALHATVQTQLIMSGLATAADMEVEYVIHDHHVRGRIDAMLRNHPDGNTYALEFKTQNGFGFDKQEDPKPEWDIQLSLGEYSQGITKGVILVMESGFPYRFKEYAHTRNDNKLDEVFDKFDSVRRAIAANKPPAHCCAYKSPEMSSCFARHACWLEEM